MSLVALVAAGTSLGGWAAGKVGQRIPEPLLRWLIVATGAVLALVLAYTAATEVLKRHLVARQPAPAASR